MHDSYVLPVAPEARGDQIIIFDRRTSRVCAVWQVCRENLHCSETLLLILPSRFVPGYLGCYDDVNISTLSQVANKDFLTPS
ncbi:hypothetical protein NDU88_004376 [Pleurodeles waltl]|uniref:Uncharacterized protein n=1 Tax=Pleurodeles waltl TaxID=8319 RepID=A0AAV7N197_PLEWA|nr:hypothetical protein NDU88_004376 [Pleurodeles waltl]